MDFSTEIANFQKTGTYTYQIDGGNNLLINPKSPEFNQNFVSIPLNNDNYSTSKLNSFYPIEFTEFISVPTLTTSTSSIEDISTQLAQSLTDNNNLQQQLTDITNLQQDNTTAADILAAQQTIISLRISLGQGAASSDFSTTFPYTALK
jgi:hypothetical protein